MAVVSVSVPKYRHHKGSGQAFVQVKGKRHYLGSFGSPKSKEAYARFVAELAVNSVATLPLATADKPALAVVELCAAYLDFAEAYYVKSGRTTSHIGTVKRAIGAVRELYGHAPAATFGPLTLRAVQQRLVEMDHSRTTINSTCGAIKRMFKWAASHELVPVATYQALATVPGLRSGRTAAREPAPIMPVDDAVVEATLPHLPHVVADMVRFQRLTGCRPTEVCQLRPMDMDRNGDVWQYRPASHKTEHHGRERVIFVGPKAQAVIDSYLLREPSVYCFCPAESEKKRHVEMRTRRKTKVQPSQRNRRKARPQRAPATSYTKDSYGRSIRRGVTKANKAIQKDAEQFGIDNPKLLDFWAPNRLRHTRATEVRRQFGLEAAQVILGHAKADVTQVYAERDHALADDVMRKIG
jgi:integrase